MARKKACDFCNNALLDDELTHDTDYACRTIGDMPKRTRLMLCTGWRKPLRIEFEVFNDQYGMWSTGGIYYPKYCPECGRKIYEYETTKP